MPPTNTTAEAAAAEAAPVPAPDNIVQLFREHVGDPDAFRLERAIGRIRRLLNDPAALRARADALLAGTATPLLGFAVAALLSFRMIAGPAVAPTQTLNHFVRRSPVAAVRIDTHGMEVA